MSITVLNYEFKWCTRLASVTIPNGVTYIGYYAFAGCTSLSPVTIPNVVTHIGDSAFYNCTSLASVTIPNGVTHIGDSAFYNCTSLASVTIPNSVTWINLQAYLLLVYRDIISTPCAQPVRCSPSPVRHSYGSKHCTFGMNHLVSV